MLRERGRGEQNERQAKGTGNDAAGPVELNEDEANAKRRHHDGLVGRGCRDEGGQAICRC